MNNVTVTNVATFEDCCTWLAKTRGKKARDTFEMQVRKIRPFLSLQGRPLTPAGIRAIYDVCDRIEQEKGTWAVHHLKNLLLLRTAQQEKEIESELNDE